MDASYLVFGLGIIFGVIGWLLTNKDKKQGEEIAELKRQHKDDVDTLYKLHHADAAKLQEFELEIARNHYPKPELDQRFSQLDATIKDGFRGLGMDIKEMTRALQKHLEEKH